MCSASPSGCGRCAPRSNIASRTSFGSESGGRDRARSPSSAVPFSRESFPAAEKSTGAPQGDAKSPMRRGCRFARLRVRARLGCPCRLAWLRLRTPLGCPCRLAWLRLRARLRRPCRLAWQRLRNRLGRSGGRRDRGGATALIGCARGARAFRFGERGNVAGELAAFLDRDFSVSDLARQFSRGANDQLLSRSQLALETSPDFGDVDAGLAHENSVLGDLDDAAVHRGLHATFDHQRVAVRDLGALQLHVRADYQLAHGFPAGPGRFRATAHVGFRTFHPRDFRLFGFVTGCAQRLLQRAVLRLQARGLREISPAKIVQHGCSSRHSRSVTIHGGKLVTQSVLPLAMRMPEATHVQNHAIARRCRVAGERPSSPSSDAASSEVTKGLFTMEVTRRAKATAVTLSVKTEALEDCLRSAQIRAG